jgi:hypothetical protein
MRYDEWCEWVDGCTWCPNGNTGCFKPHRHVQRVPAAGGGSAFVYSSSAKCMPVAFEVSGLCQGVAVAGAVPNMAEVYFNSNKSCAEHPSCKPAYNRYKLAQKKGLQILSPGVYNVIIYGGENSMGL